MFHFLKHQRSYVLLFVVTVSSKTVTRESKWRQNWRISFCFLEYDNAVKSLNNFPNSTHLSIIFIPFCRVPINRLCSILIRSNYTYRCATLNTSSPLNFHRSIYSHPVSFTRGSLKRGIVFEDVGFCCWHHGVVDFGCYYHRVVVNATSKLCDSANVILRLRHLPATIFESRYSSSQSSGQHRQGTRSMNSIAVHWWILSKYGEDFGKVLQRILF